MNDYMNNNR